MKQGTIEDNGVTIIDSKSAANGHGNYSTLYLSGDFGGGTVTANITPDNGTTLFDFTGNTASAKSFMNIDAKTTKIVLTLAGATSPDLNWWLV